MTEIATDILFSAGFITVGIYHTDTRMFKMFDSHAKDAFGKSHPQGTCVLLEVPSIQKLVQYFQGMHASDEVYELKGVHVTTYDINEFVNSDSEAANCSWKQCGALGLYAIQWNPVNTDTKGTRQLKMSVLTGVRIKRVNFRENV